VYFHSWTGSGAWTEGPALLGYNRAINREKPDIEKVERELDDPASFRFYVYHGLQKMIAFRQGEEAFNPDREQLVLDAKGGVFALLRRRGSETGRALLCLINLSPCRAVWKAPAQPELLPECTTVNLEAWETLWISFDGAGIVSRFSTVKET
jgi:sucrose phosphorylase